MTEAEWLACRRPWEMLAALRARHFNFVKAGRRRLRLFGCACCRRIWRLLDAKARRWVERAEGMADGGPPLSPQEQQELEQEARRPHSTTSVREQGRIAASYTLSAKVMMATGAGTIVGAALAMKTWKQKHDNRAAGRVCLKEAAAEVALLREVFGNPFRPVRLNPAWLRYQDGAAPNLARSIYEERAFDRLPILADALEDAGCDHADLLAHCRQPGEHVRGCWVVDTLLGRA
jgi:hypothetical protein